MLLSNTLSAAVPGTPGKLVEATFWTLEKAEALKTRLDKLGSGVSDGIGDAVRTVTIGAEAVQGSMDNLARHMSLNADVSVQPMVPAGQPAPKLCQPARYRGGQA